MKWQLFVCLFGNTGYLSLLEKSESVTGFLQMITVKMIFPMRQCMLKNIQLLECFNTLLENSCGDITMTIRFKKSTSFPHILINITSFYQIMWIEIVLETKNA